MKGFIGLNLRFLECLVTSYSLQEPRREQSQFLTWMRSADFSRGIVQCAIWWAHYCAGEAVTVVDNMLSRRTRSVCRGRWDLSAGSLLSLVSPKIFVRPLPNFFLGQVQSWGLAFGKPLAPWCTILGIQLNSLNVLNSLPKKMFISLPIGPWGFLSFSMSYLESSWPWVEFNILNNFFFELYSLGGILHLHIQEWIIEGAICYIELACVVPLSGGETVYIKVLIFISEATCEQLCVP